MVLVCTVQYPLSRNLLRTRKLSELVKLLNGFCFLGIAAFDNEELKKVKTKEPLSGLDLLKQVHVIYLELLNTVSYLLYLHN
jgi:hypothetical protein